MNANLTRSSILSLLSIFAISGCGAMQEGVDIGFKIGQGKGLTKMKKFAEADQDFDEALAKIDKDEADKSLPTSVAHSFRAHAFTAKAILYTKQDKKEDARKYFEKAKQLFESQSKLTISAKSNFKECLQAYADFLRSDDKKEDATKLDEQAAKI
jgi:tetratricopeptide (TPR) repeat protein